MKKLFFLLLSIFLVLAACGNEEESMLDDKKETKSENKDKETDKEKESGKKEDKSNNNEKSNEEVANNANKPNRTSQEKQKMENQNNTQQQDSNINNNEGPTQQGNRPFGGIPPKGMTNEEYQVLENNMPNANNVSSEEYEKLLNEQVQRIANKNNHSIETPMGTFTPNNHNENTDQNQKIDLNKMPAGGFSTEGMSEEAKNKIEELTRQKEFEGLSQEEYNDRVSEIMNEEMNNN